MQVDVHIPEENRNKSGEFFITRVDASAVVAWRQGENFSDSQVVFVRESRSAAAVGDGFVWELPVGSAFEDDLILDDEFGTRQQATSELAEETGVTIDTSRFEHIASRQSAATLLTHQTHLYAVQLSEIEMQKFRDEAGIVHGENDSERCMVHVFTLREVMEHKSIDWSQLGMVFSSILANVRM